MNIKTTLQTINRRKLTSNTQKAAFRLLKANGAWVSRKDLERTISSASARVRDLRKSQFGGFKVEASSGSALNKRRATRGSWYYRIVPDTVSEQQISKIFNK